MSVLIKGMAMPKNCCECRLLSGFECRALFKDITDFSVADECPLVPVPSHGRLIDADAICYQLEKRATIDGQPRAIRRARCMVESAPTIIEAEEGE